MEVYMNQYVNQPNSEPTLPFGLCGDVGRHNISYLIVG